MEVDKSMGLIPFFVVATLGTTGICAFDPLDELGPICEENKAWLHIDAAYAGSAFICEEYRYLMNGIDYADSFNVNTHKWLLVNVGCSAMWVKDGFDVVQAMNVQRIYLDDVQGVPNYRHWQLPLGRKFSALKLWTVLKMYGGEGLRNHIRSQVGFAQYFADLVRSDERFVVEPEPSMGLTCIRLVESDKMTRKLLDNLVASKQIFMVPTTFRNRFLIRVVICSHFTTKEDIDVSWDIIKRETDILVPPGNRISID
ncbi:unnamed protein product [Leptosia nina]|uniref:Dopa decarboxylase n=1 Tax=Leptosia nina TaxID=320188 RepID=A0AAV1JD42_9NEOP